MPSERTCSAKGVRPSGNRLVDPPVAETRGVVAAAMEPAVVEHEPFDPDPAARSAISRRRCRSWSKKTASHTLRTTGWCTGCESQRALLGVPRRRQTIQALVGRPEDDPRGGIRLVLREHRLTGISSSPPPRVAPRQRRAPAGTSRCRSRPRGRRGPDGAGAEAGRPEDGDRRTAEPGRPSRDSRRQRPSVRRVTLRGASASWRPVKSSASVRSSAAGRTTSSSREEGAGRGRAAAACSVLAAALRATTSSRPTGRALPVS